MALLVSLGGCGGASSSHSHSAGQPVAAAPSNGVARESAGQILGDVEHALMRVRSFHLDGFQVDAHSGRMRVSGDVALPGRIRIRLAQGDQAAAIVAVSGTVYLIANARYWAAHTRRAAVANLLANRWILVPAAVSSSDFGSLLALSNQRTFARCFIGHHGKLTVVGTATEAHHRTVVLKDNGDAPGDSPGEAYISTTGPPLPLRVVQTGPEKPGGTPNIACGESSAHPDTTISSDLRLSRFDLPVKIAPPKHPLVLPGQGVLA